MLTQVHRLATVSTPSAGNYCHPDLVKLVVFTTEYIQTEIKINSIHNIITFITVTSLLHYFKLARLSPDFCAMTT
jgi:hypothetical protein